MQLRRDDTNATGLFDRPCSDAREQLAGLAANLAAERHGEVLVDYQREGLPSWDYAVFVSRAAQPDRYEIFPATLQKRLPKFRLPLAADDRDTVIDLQAAFTRAYDQGDFAKHINYDSDPATKLSVENRDWLRQRLDEQNKR